MIFMTDFLDIGSLPMSRAIYSLPVESVFPRVCTDISVETRHAVPRYPKGCSAAGKSCPGGAASAPKRELARPAPDLAGLVRLKCRLPVGEPNS